MYKQARSSRGWILAVALIHFVIGLSYVIHGWYRADDGSGWVESGITGVILAALFLLCWLWAKRQPFCAALIAFLVYTILTVGYMVFVPEQAHAGIIGKTIVIAGLCVSVVSAYKLKLLQKDNR